jgi:hypothetical protein
MNTRRPLPQRRRSENFDMEFGGFSKRYYITVGYYDDGGIGEVFINHPVSGLQSEAIARDGAVAVSLALQYGVPLETLQHAVTRNDNNEPTSIVGAVVDRLMQMESTNASA